MTELHAMDGAGFCFVFNLSGLSSSEIEVGQGMVLKRANAGQIERIKGWLTETAGLSFNLGQPWEYEYAGAEYGKLLPENRRYFVIEFEGSEDDADFLQHVFDISPVDLEIGLTVFERGKSAGGMISAPSRYIPTVDGYMFDNIFLEASDSDFAVTRKTFDLLRDYDSELMDVKRALEQISHLKRLPPKSGLVYLGLFAILESFLTHEPKQSDPYSSITRQVKTKLALLNKRFDVALDYSRFKGATADTVWTKMYEYRSRIAHGAPVEFSGTLNSLIDHQTAKHLLSSATKAVIRQALREPQLISDLRNC